jgi:tRNA pseudouridine-54 N-methylase
VLEEAGADVRTASIDSAAPAFFIGDHLGFDDATRARLTELKPVAISLGPVSVQADDAIVITSNELDRRS